MLMKNKILSKAYGGVTEARRKLYGLGLPRQWKVITSTLLLLFTFAIGQMWGHTFSSANIVAGNVVQDNVTVTGTATSTTNVSQYYKVGSTKYAADVVQVKGKCNGGTLEGITDYIEIKASANCYLNSPIVVRGSSNGTTTDKNLAVLGWNGDAANNNITYYEQHLFQGYDQTSLEATDVTITFTVPLKTIRIYAQSKVKDGALNSSGTQKGAGSAVNILQVTATAGYFVTINPNGGAYASTPSGWSYDNVNKKYTKYVASGSFSAPDGLSKGTDVLSWKDNHDNDITFPVSINKDTIFVAQWATSSCNEPTTAFANGSYTVDGTPLTLSSLISDSQGEGTISYSVKDANGTGASIAAGVFTATTAGTATVTATQAADATNGYCQKVMEATITVLAAGAVEYNISYADTKGATNSNPAKYTKGTGIAEFAALADVTDFHFTGWSPASISAEATGAQEITAQWVAAYNVTFSYGTGGGTVPTSFQKWEGAKFNLPGQGSMTAPSGKVFDGWKVSGTKYAANAEYTMGNAAVEFVAQWKNVPTTIFHWRSNISSNPSLDQVISATGGSLTTRSYKTSSKGSFQTQSVSSYVAGTPDDMKANSGKSGIKCNNNDVYLKLALSSGKLKSGDTIWICGYGTIKMYKSITLGSGYNDQITSLTMSGTGTNTFGVNTTACVIPQVENEDVEYDSLCLTRNSNGYLAAIKIVRPAEKEVKSTVNTLTDVKVNGTSIAAGDLATLVSTHSLALDDAEATAPKITFNKHTVITYVDDTQKVTDTPIEETAADNGAGKWAASTTIDAVTYTVTLNIATGYHVTYKANGGDGIMTDANLYAAGDEVIVLDNAFTAPAANKKFNGWTSSPVVTISGEGKFEMPASDVELSAVWTEFFTITYKDGDETLDTEDVFVGGTPAGLSPAPTKPLYVFGGWVNDVEEDVDITAITTATTVYVKWNKAYVPQGTNYVFENTATLGTAPNAITVTKDNNKNSIAANSRIDNMWLSAMDVKLEDGTYSGSGDDFKGWKINTSGATIRFFVENDSNCNGW